jgi:hypothetical protein
MLPTQSRCQWDADVWPHKRAVDREERRRCDPQGPPTCARHEAAAARTSRSLHVISGRSVRRPRTGSRGPEHDLPAPSPARRFSPRTREMAGVRLRIVRPPRRLSAATAALLWLKSVLRVYAESADLQTDVFSGYCGNRHRRHGERTASNSRRIARPVNSRLRARCGSQGWQAGTATAAVSRRLFGSQQGGSRGHARAGTAS